MYRFIRHRVFVAFRQLLQNFRPLAPSMEKRVSGAPTVCLFGVCNGCLIRPLGGAVLFHFNSIGVLFHSDCKYRYKAPHQSTNWIPPCIHNPAFVGAENQQQINRVLLNQPGCTQIEMSKHNAPPSFDFINSPGKLEIP